MGIQIIHNKDNLFASGYIVSDRYFISLAHSIAVRCSCTLTWCFPPSGSINAKMLHVPFLMYSESIVRSSPFRIEAWDSCIPEKLIWLLVHTYYWIIPVKWEFIYIKNILHMCYEFGISFLGDAPVSVPLCGRISFFNVRAGLSHGWQALQGSSSFRFQEVWWSSGYALQGQGCMQLLWL